MYSLIAFLLQNRGIVISILLAFALAGVGTISYLKGRAGAQLECAAEMQEEEAKRQAVVIAAQHKTFADMVLNQKISNEVANDYESQIADLDTRYNAALERLRHNAGNAGSDPVSAPGASTGQCPAAASGNRLSRRAEEDLIRLMRHADEQTRRLQACQSWAKRQAAQ